MNKLTIDGVEPPRVTDEFILHSVSDCLTGKKLSAFGMHSRLWAAHMESCSAIGVSGSLAGLLSFDLSKELIEATRQAVIEKARELIDMAYAHGWTDQLEEWGVWQREI